MVCGGIDKTDLLDLLGVFTVNLIPPKTHFR